jgi:hypothetical protein
MNASQQSKSQYIWFPFFVLYILSHYNSLDFDNAPFIFQKILIYPPYRIVKGGI